MDGLHSAYSFIDFQLPLININQAKAPVNKVAFKELIINILLKTCTHVVEKKGKVLEGWVKQIEIQAK